MPVEKGCTMKAVFAAATLLVTSPAWAIPSPPCPVFTTNSTADVALSPTATAGTCDTGRPVPALAPPECTLRAAVQAANLTASCTASSSFAGPVILVTAGTYVLSLAEPLGAPLDAGGDLNIENAVNPITIIGHTPLDTIIDGSGFPSSGSRGPYAIFNATAPLTIANVTITGGKHAGIWTTHPLNLSHVAVVGNDNTIDDGGGIHAETSISIRSTLIANNMTTNKGGGLAVTGVCSGHGLIFGTVTGNTAADVGGGVYSSGCDLTLDRETITGNVGATDDINASIR